MPPRVRQLTRTSVSLAALYVLLSATLQAAAEDNPATLPPVVPSEVMVPTQRPTPDPAQQRAREFDAVQKRLRTAAEQLTSFQQQQAELGQAREALRGLPCRYFISPSAMAELGQAREALSGQLAVLEQQMTALEHNFILAREAEVTARGLVGEHDATAARLGEQLVTLDRAKGNLEQQLEQARQACEQAARDLNSREDRSATLERNTNAAQHEATATQQEVEQHRGELGHIGSQLEQPTGKEAVLNQRPAGAVQARDAAARDIAARDQRIAVLDYDLAEARQAGGQAREEADQLAHQVKELTAARVGLERQLAKIGRTRDLATRELQSRAVRMAALERDATEAQQKLKERSAEIERLTSDLPSAAERTKLLEQAGRDVRAGPDRTKASEYDLGSAHQRIEEHRGEVDRTSQRGDKLEGTRIALEQQLAYMTNARDQAAKDLNAREQYIASLERDLVLSRETAEQSRAEAQRLNQQLMEAIKARGQTVRDFQARDQRITALESDAARPQPARSPAANVLHPGGSNEGQASGAEYYVAADHTNLRAAPSSEAAVVAVVEPGAILRSLDRRIGWLQVEYDSGRTGKSIGWIYRALLRPTEAPKG